jgi:integrase
MAEIHKVGERRKLLARNEPYWRHIEGAGYIGYRKSPTGLESWQAKWRGRDGKPIQKSLGRVTDKHDYEAALAEARTWFEQCDFGATRAVTVEGACKAYVEAKKLERGDTAETLRSPGLDAEIFFKRQDYEKPFGMILLNDLNANDVEQFRNSLLPGRKKVSVNRLFRVFKAAMRRARRKRLIMFDPWTDVDEFKAESDRRENFLSEEQLNLMFQSAPADLATLLRGFRYLGCRPGELAKALVKDLDLKTNKLRLSTGKGKDGIVRTRYFPLGGEALEFFKTQAKDKLPNAYLVMQADGQPWIRHQWSRGLTELRAVESLPADLVAYDIRHTMISNWLMNGIDVATVAKITGTSIAMIQKHYFKFIPDNVAEKLSAARMF